MFSAKDLLEKQLEEIANRSKKAKVSKGIVPSKQAAIRYNSDLQKLVRAIKKDINTKIVPLIRALEPQYIQDAAVNDGWASDIALAFQALVQKWQSLPFTTAANQTAQQFVNNINSTNQSRFVKNAKAIGIDVFGQSPNMQELLDSTVFENTRLIRTIPDQYLNQVQSIVVTNMKAGLRPSNIVSQLSNQFGITKRRAKLIARDQTSKANGEISKERQGSAGFEFFKWVTAEDSRVRDDHDDIADDNIGFGVGIYRWNAPPKNNKGQRIIPGQEINCRCIAIPWTLRQVNEYREGAGLPLLKKAA